MIFTASRIDAQEAAEIGLVDEIVSSERCLSRSLELAHTIASRGPLAVRLAKDAIDSGLDKSLAEGMSHEERCYGVTIGSDDRREGLMAFREKRPAIFKGS